MRVRCLPLPARLRCRVLTTPPGMRLAPGGVGTFVQLCSSYFAVWWDMSNNGPSVLQAPGAFCSKGWAAWNNFMGTDR